LFLEKKMPRERQSRLSQFLKLSEVDDLAPSVEIHGPHAPLILWRIDPFLSNDRGTNNTTTTTAREQILNKQQLNYKNRGAV
jgi:hypothetical protein